MVDWERLASNLEKMDDEDPYWREGGRMVVHPRRTFGRPWIPGHPTFRTRARDLFEDLPAICREPEQ